MRKRFWSLFVLLLFAGGVALAQQAVQFGSHQIVPEQNLKKLRTERVRGAAVPTLQQLDPTFAASRNFALLQFEAIPTALQREALKKNGVELLDYMGGEAYFAVVPSNVDLANVAAANANALVPIKPEWKINEHLLNKEELPEWTKATADRLKVTLGYFPVEQSFVKTELAKHGITPKAFSQIVRVCDLEITAKEIEKLATLPWVASITLAAPPQELYNYYSRIISRSNILQLSNDLGGRGLSGEGVRVGIWDGNVGPHVDYGNRRKMMEDEILIKDSDSHGMHVAGTVAGAGILDPKARGMAPKAKFYTYNFNVQSNGKREGEEMLDCFKEFGISISQNSYGPYLKNLCAYQHLLVYNVTQADYVMDMLAMEAPTLTLVFASGNDQGSCGKYYGSVVRRAKNIMLIGAVKSNGMMTDFSSLGPQDDGRIAPIVCAMGQNVYSCIKDDGYRAESGTSMSCPSTSGTLALLTERYHQLNGGQDPRNDLMRAVVANTADDAGRWGPDYAYGYGIINGKRAAEVFEARTYSYGKPLHEKDAAHIYSVQVPAGTKYLKAMIVWNDTVTHKANHRLGAPALVNDLDLQIEKDGKVYLPWVLDAKNPRKRATTGVDRLNNIEQVLIEDPKPGLYNLSVLPARIVSSKQDYVITWFIEKNEIDLTYPIGGEKVEPGEEIKVAWNKVYDDVDVDLSYDNGKTYQTVARGVKTNVTTIVIPKDAPHAGEAKVRVRWGEKFSESPNPFTIMPVPQNVMVKANDCSTAGWKLFWDGVKGAKKYKILKADVPNGEFKAIGEVEATEKSYALASEDVSYGSENIFTVVAVGEKGIESERAVAAFAKAITRLPKSEGVILEETFVRFPSQYIKIDSTENNWGLEVSYKEDRWDDYEHGSHVLVCVSKRDATETSWKFGEYPPSFDPNINDHAAHFQICNMDLSGIPAGKKIILAVEKRQRYANTPRHSVFTVKVAGEELNYMDIGAGEGKIAMGAPKGDTPSYYDLSKYRGQQNVTVDMYWAGRNSWVDQLYLDRIRVFVPEEKSDLQLNRLILPKSAAGLGEEPISAIVVNNGNRTAEGVKLHLKINGELKGIFSLSALKPYERRTVVWPSAIDFSTTEPRGKKFEIAMEVVDANDIRSNNNVKTGTVVNFGDTYIHPYSPHYTGFMGTYAIDPLKVKYVEKSFIYTDNGGDGGDYPALQSSTVHFMPSKPGNVVMITFYEYCSEEDDLLAIATHYKHTDLVITDDQFYEHIFRGDYNNPTTGKMDRPMTFISKNEDGSIGVYFRSNNDGYENVGWVAEVREVTPTNLFKLQEIALEAGFHPDGKVPVKATVKNLTDNALSNVRIAYSLDDENWEYETIPALAAKQELVYTFKTKADLPPATPKTLHVVIVSEDYDATDNDLAIKVINDRYCATRSYAQGGDCIVAVDGREGHWELSYSKKGDYQDHEYATEKEFVLYRPDEKASLVLTTDELVKPANFAFRAWVDWNDNGTFDGGKETIAPVTPEKGVTTYRLNFDIPADAKIGKLRLRIASAPEVYNTDCGKVAEAGNMVDLTIDLRETKNPVQLDRAIRSIIVKNAEKLNDDEKVRVYVANLTSKPVPVGRLILAVDDTLPIIEESEQMIPAFDSVEYTFQQRVDLSKVGAHNITITAADDDNNENNQATFIAYCVIPVEGKQYALNLKEYQPRTEGLDCGDLGGIDLVHNGATYEAWIYPRETEINHLFRGKGIVVALFNNPDSDMAPINSIVVIVNEGRLFYPAKPNTIKQGMWQHVAVVLDPTKKKEIKIYINGEEIAMNVKGFDELVNKPKSHLFVASDYEGMIDEIRVWAKARTKEEIKEYMKKHAKGAVSASAKLVREYQLNEGPGNQLAMYTEDEYALIRTDRAHDAVDGAWQETTQMLKAISSPMQTRPAKVNGDEVRFWFRQGSDLKKIKLNVEALWPDMEFTYNGKTITDETEFDFSGSTIELKAAYYELFGHKFDKPITITGKYDVSDECDLLELSVLKKDNLRLAADVVKTPVSQTEFFVLPGITDLSAVRFTYKASDFSKVYYRGKELEAGKTFVDLRESAIFTVVSENEQQSRSYVVRVPRKTVFFAPELPTTMAYGEGKQVAIKAPVVLRTANSKIVAIDGKTLYATGVGSTEVSAVLPSNGVEPEQIHKVTVVVTPREVTVAPEEVEIPFAVPVGAYELAYNPPVSTVEKIILDDLLKRKVSFELYNGAQKWDRTTNLAIGEYTWKPNTTEVIASGNYKVTPATSKLKVVASATTQNVKFHVTDAQDAPLVDAIVKINGLNGKTSAAGIFEVALNTAEADEFQYIVSKEGYSVAEGVWKKKENQTDVNVKLVELTYTLKYIAGAHGVIEGKTEQKVAKNGNGTLVYASADAGYKFEKWSDNKTDNPRTDENITANLTVTATFTNFIPKFTYIAGAGGKIGTQAQKVVNNPDGTQEVEAVPDAGYSFVRWSDGKEDPKRADANLLADRTVYAYFTIDRELPFKEDFDAYDEMPEGWINVDQTGNGAWQLTRSYVGQLGTIGTKNFVAINSQLTGPDKEVKVDLISPWIKLDKSKGDLKISFDYKYDLIPLNVQPSQGFFVFYTTDGSQWHQLFRCIEEKPKGERAEISLKRDDLNSATKIRFKWHYKDVWGKAAIFDNIKVEATTIEQFTVMYVADKGGTVKTTDPSKTLPSLQAFGTEGPEVKAVPDAGYRFDKWSDGREQNPRKDVEFTYVHAMFARTSNSNRYQIAYTASEGGYLTGLTLQTLGQDEETSPVLARPEFGYKFKQWEDDNSKPALRTDKVVANATYKALFEKLTAYPVTFESAAHGSFVVTHNKGKVLTSGEECPEGDALVVQTTPDDGYFLSTLTVNGTPAVPDARGLYHITVKAATTIVVTFKPLAYTVTFIATRGGTIEGTSVQTIEVGKDATPVVAKADAGKEFVRWSTGSRTPELQIKAVKANATYTAFFREPANVLVTFHSNGGSNVESAVLRKGTTLTLLETPFRDGYTFGGWKTDKAATVAFDASKPIVENTDLYAAWTPITYTVAFDANTGTGTMANVSMTYDKPEALPANTFTNAGKTFAGWSTAATSPVLYNDGMQVVNLTLNAGATVTLYAQWENGTVSSHTVSFNTHDGTVVTAQKVLNGKKAMQPVSPTKLGAAFAGWYTSADYTTQYNFDNAVTADLELHARWTPSIYRIHFNAGEGWGEMHDQSLVYGEETPLDKCQFVYTTFAFNGWATTPNGEAVYADGAKVKDLASEDGAQIELYATWKEIYHTVTFVTNGAGDIASVTVREGQTIDKPQDPEKEGFIFVGWYLDSEFTGPYNFARAVTSDLTLYAAWRYKASSFTLTIAPTENGTIVVKNAAGRELTTGAGLIPDSKILVIATPKEGYKLKELKVNDEIIESETEITVTKDIKVEALFESVSAVEDVAFAEVVVAPNPFANQLRIVNYQWQNGDRYELLNVNGQTVRTGYLQTAETLIETSELSEGIYILRLIAANGATKTYRVVKQ